MGYDNDEKTSAIQELVQGTLSFPSTRLGTQDRGAEYTEISELVASVLVFDPDAVFYLIYLTAKRLQVALSAEITACTNMLSAVDDLSMPNRPLEDIGGLLSARQAVRAMEGALSRRGSVGGAEYRRYANATTRLKRNLRRVVRMDYVPRGGAETVRDIVRPRAEAQVATATAFTALKALHSTTLRKVQWLQDAFSEFVASGVASVAGQRQLTRAAEQLDDLYDILEPLSSAERTVEAREALLRVLSNEAVVQMLAEGKRPGDTRINQKPAAAPDYRVLAYGTGQAPSITGTVCAPYPLYDSVAGSPTNILNFGSLNGGAVVSDLFPAGSSWIEGIQPAELIGNKEGNFAISGDLATPSPMLSAAETYDTRLPAAGGNGNMFYVIVEGIMYEYPLPQNAALTAAAAAAALQAAGAPWVRYSDMSNTKPPLTFTAVGGHVQMAYSNGTPPVSYAERYMEVTTGYMYAQDLWNWSVGATTPVVRSSGWNANNKLRIKPNDMPTYVEVTLPSGTWPAYSVTAASVVAAITAAAVAAGENFIGDVDPSPGGNRVVVRSTVEGEGSIITILSDGLRVAPDTRAGLLTPSMAGALTLGFASDQEDRQSDVDVRVVMNVLNGDTNFSPEAVATSDRVEYLESRRATRTGAQTIAVQLDSDPTGGWPAYGQLKVEVRTGDNRGIYSLTGAPTFAGGVLTFSLDRRLRDTTVGLLHVITVYRERLVITSLDSSLTGEIDLDAHASSAHTVLGFDLNSHVSTISSVQVQVNDPLYGWRGTDLSSLFVRVGDLFYDGGGTYQTSVNALTDLPSGIVGVSPAVVPTFSLTTQGFEIRSLPHDKYLEIIEAVDDWLEGTLPPYESDLHTIDRAMSQLLLGTPSKAAVDTLYALVESLRTRLSTLHATLDGVTVSKIQAVETALQALLEQGHDRARMLLLDGRYSLFFETTGSNSSYGRAFQAAVNEVIVEDVNASSMARGRFDSEFMRVRSAWTDGTDPEWDFSDMEEELPSDPVIDYYRGDGEDEV